VTGAWHEVGEPGAYLAALLDRLRGRSVILPGATVEPGATLVAAFIGAGARVEAGATVVESVVAEGAAVRRGARVRRSVLLGAVQAGEWETVAGEVRARHHQP
jgi:mannose-1-phosphate guanylyltransferase